MRNVGNLDRVIRLLLGIIVAALPFWLDPGAWGAWSLFVAGAVLVATAAFGMCPIYAALGLSTRRKAA